MLTNYVPAIIRTFIPGLVGFLVSLPVVPPLLRVLGVDTPAATKAVTSLITFALMFVYYALAKGLEERFPALGILLGLPSKPVYGVTDLAPAELVSAPAAAPVVVNVHPADADALSAALAAPPQDISATQPSPEPTVDDTAIQDALKLAG